MSRIDSLRDMLRAYGEGARPSLTDAAAFVLDSIWASAAEAQGFCPTLTVWKWLDDARQPNWQATIPVLRSIATSPQLPQWVSHVVGNGEVDEYLLVLEVDLSNSSDGSADVDPGVCCIYGRPDEDERIGVAPFRDDGGLGELTWIAPLDARFVSAEVASTAQSQPWISLN